MPEKKMSGNHYQKELFDKKRQQIPANLFTGEKPNTNIRQFVLEHLKQNPYVFANDSYNTKSLSNPTYGRKNTAIYNMHMYWSKKPHEAIDLYIKHFTKENDLILDPMCGSGSTIISCVTNNRKAIGIDLSPIATFVTANYSLPLPLNDIHNTFDNYLDKTIQEALPYYLTTCSHCKGDAITNSVDYSAVYKCDRCLNEILLYYCEAIDKKRYCPYCYRKDILEEISTRRSTYLGERAFRTSYSCISKCKIKRAKREYTDIDFQKYDLQRLKDNSDKKLMYWYPDKELPKKTDSYRMKKAGAKNVKDLFSPTNLHVLSIFFHHSHDISFIKFILNSSLFMASRMVRESNTQILPGRYYIPPIRRDLNVINTIKNKFKNFIKLQKALEPAEAKTMISTQDASDLSCIPANSVDYIFTDPPYGDKFQNYELNFLWEAWQGYSTTWDDKELIINKSRSLDEARWGLILKNIFQECYRVLKPGRWLTLCYHDTSDGTWELVQDCLTESGFIPDAGKSATYIETNQKSFKQYTADLVNKRDLIINLRKPKPGEITQSTLIIGDEDTLTFKQKVCSIISEYLSANPGDTKDRIYDEVVSRMVRSGKMEAHDFDAFLREVAEEVKTPVLKNLFEQKEPDLFGTHEISRWYLKETELNISDAAETAKEDEAADKLANFMEDYLKKQPVEEGVHYSDIFEHYVYSVKEKPRRQLVDFLPDYFYKTQGGTWRPAATEEEVEVKAQGRIKGISRQVKRYLAQLDLGGVIPEKQRPNDSTLAEWIRHCKRSGLYEQGKFLYEKGGLDLNNLPEDIMVDVEEDYQVCVRMIERGKK